MATPKPPATAQQASPFESLLAQSRDLVIERLAQALSGMLDKAEESLTGLINATQNAEAQKIYVAARDKVLKERGTIEQQFQSRYLHEFQQRSRRANKTGGGFADVDISALELDLVGEDDLEESLKFNNMAGKVRKYCDEELAALDQRAGVLLGDADLQSEDNPFSPQAICDAFKNTCRQVDSEVKVRLVFLKLFDDHVVDEVRSIYKAVNELLVQNAILPKIRYGVSRQEGGKAPPAGAREQEGEKKAAAPTADKGEGDAQDIFSALQKLLARKGDGTGGAPGIPAGAIGANGAPVVVLQGAELLNSLSRLQRGEAGTAGDGGVALPVLSGEPGTTNVLNELKRTSVGSSMGQMDAMTLDIVAMLFDQLFDDPKVPIGVKGLIGRMQIPMLRVAIADKAFFSQKSHPARQLLDTLGEIAIRLPAEFDASNPLFGRLETIIQELVSGFQENLEIFDSAREKLQKLVAEEDQRVEKEAQAAAKVIEQKEMLAAAKTAAQEEIKARLRIHRVPRPIVDFFVQHWLKLLLLIHVKRGKDSDPWKNALETMDQLIWSVEPKPKLEERKKLAAAVPALIKRLGAGMKAIGVPEAASSRFLADLMKLHTELIDKADEPPKPAAPPEPPAATTKEAVMRAAAIKPKPPAPAEPKGTETPEFNTPVVIQNPFGAGEVQVDDLDFTASQTAPGAAPAPAKQRGPGDEALTASLVQGIWVEFREKDPDKDEVRNRPAKLSFVSPHRTRYLFIDRAGKTVLECSRAEIARRLRLREVVVMDEPPLFDRIMGGVMGKLKEAVPS